ncbi:MAG TPA: sulfatase-like hydrolase/transferase [Bryobacteraceae bacterium]|nr:sulfatase-like hydrolase/transferase [Bryobacteraceae bacterium]
MRRREMFKGLLAAPLLAGDAASDEASDAERAVPLPRVDMMQRPKGADGRAMPNILWICADQTRFDTIEELNNPYVHTPNLKRLMGEGVTFTHYAVQCPICSPSRAAFLTGRYPHTTGLRANGQRIRADERLVPRILADAGYECGLVGKLHLSPCEGGRIEDRIDDGYDLFLWSHDLSDQWPTANMWRVWLREQGVAWPSQAPHTPAWGVPIDPKYTQTAWCADKAIQMMRQERGYRPWLISVNIFQPHHPFWPAEEYFRRYDPARIPSPKYREGELQTKSPYARTDYEGAYGGRDISFAKTDDLTHRKITAAYYAMIEQVDHAIGRMLDVLKETGQDENTIVIYSSDHGEMLGDHGIYLKGPYFYEPLIRVPLIIRWPRGYKAGLKMDALVEEIDLAPTLLEAAGIPIPFRMQGRPLTKLLKGETDSHRASIYSEFYNSNFEYSPPPWATMVRTERYKLVVYHSLGGWGELYDLEKDPWEFSNLWDDGNARGLREQMQALMIARMSETVDPYPLQECSW